MSRRRKKRAEGKTRKGGSWWLRGIAIFMGLALLVMGGGYAFLKSWLHGEDFREMLSEQASEGMEAEAKFGEFRWDGTEVSCASFEADGDEILKSLDARGLSLDIGLSKIADRTVQIRNAKVTQIELELDVTGKEKTRPEKDPQKKQPSKREPKGESWYEKFVPNQVELTGLTVDHSALSLLTGSGELGFEGTRWRVEPGQTRGSYRAHGQGGVITLPVSGFPSLRMDDLRLSYQDGSVFLTEAGFRVYDRGRLDLAGEASVEGGGFSIDGELTDVMAAEVLPEDWKQKIEGRLESSFTVTEAGRGVSVDGSMEFFDGVLTGLPVLDSLGAYGGSPRFRRLSLSRAALDYEWRNGNLLLSNIILASEGLIQLEGRLRIDRDENLNGRFRVGLTPGTLSRIPGAETKVFQPGKRGLLWTTLNLTGTLDDPQEDLTDRLITAAGLRMFEILPESGERVLKFTRRVADEDVIEAIKADQGLMDQGEALLKSGKALLDGDGNRLENAEDVIRQADVVLRGVSGLLDGLNREEPESEDEAEESN